MKKLSFKKGWFPTDGLAFAGDTDFPREPVLEIFTPVEIVLPMQQHIGTPAEPTVSVGEYVSVGQMVGKPTSLMSAPVHSGVSGVVTDISSKKYPGRPRSIAITIHNDLKRKQHRSLKERVEPERLTPDELQKLLAYSGVVGMGGKGIPSSAKIFRAKKAGVDTVLVNACQSEPYLTCDIHLLREQTNRVFRGACAIAGACRAKRIVFCLQDKWEVELEVLRDSFDTHNSQHPDREFEIRIFRSRFPQGYEKLLIKAIYDVEMPADKGSEETVKAVVFNTSTCAAFWDMVSKNQPLISRMISISGDTINGHNALVPIGTSVKELLARVPGAKTAHHVVLGGAITGVGLENMDIPIIKTTTGITLIRKFDPTINSCLHCGACVEACPVGLLPYLCHLYVEKNETDMLRLERVDACISCGACSYVCPAGIELSANIARAGSLVRKEKRR